ncbi:MAG: hypothetical protein Phyf2KO_17260 [Phycisphaerales bacterium]
MAVILVIINYNSTTKWDERAQRGDFWGGHIAAGASVVANLLLVITLLLQREELKLQREELRATREEMVHSREVAERQEAAMREQVLVSRQASELHQLFELGRQLDVLRDESSVRDIFVKTESGLQKIQVWRECYRANQYVCLCDLIASRIGILSKEDSRLSSLSGVFGLEDDKFYFYAQLTSKYSDYFTV